MEAIDVDGSFNARLIRLGVVELDGSGNRIELAAHIGDHHVPYLEARRAMLRIDLISHLFNKIT